MVKDFFLPDHEGLVIHDSRLDDLLALEDSPGDSVDIILADIEMLDSFIVYCLVCYHREFVKICNQGL